MDPRKIAERFTTREGEYTTEVKKLDKQIWWAACGMVAFFVAAATVSFFAIGLHGEWFIFSFLSVALALTAYPLFSQLRHLREKRNRFEVCREDYFRKGVIAEYILIAGISDGARRQDAIAKFQSHLADRSSAEFLSDWGSPDEGGDGKASLRHVIETGPPGQIPNGG